MAHLRVQCFAPVDFEFAGAILSELNTLTSLEFCREFEIFGGKLRSTSIRNRPVLGLAAGPPRTGFCRISIYYAVSRILPDRNRVLGSVNIRLLELLN